MMATAVFDVPEPNSLEKGMTSLRSSSLSRSFARSHQRWAGPKKFAWPATAI